MKTSPVHGPRVMCFRWEGLDLVAIENEKIRLVLWPEHGGDLIEFRHKPTDIDALWKNPRVWPPRLQPLAQPHGARSEFYDVFHGGWFVSLPNGFHPSAYFGAPLGCHGEMHSIPWRLEHVQVDDHEVRVRVRGSSVRTHWALERDYILRSQAEHVCWTDRLSNRSGTRQPVAWLQHPTFGGPLIEGAELLTTARTVEVPEATRPELGQLQSGYEGRWPLVPEQGRSSVRDCSRVPPRGSADEHVVMLRDFSPGWGAIWNEQRRLGFGIRWDERVFSHAWSWACGSGGDSYPLWGACHTVTLQPSTSRLLPFETLIARDDVRWVPSEATVTTTLAAGFIGNRDTLLPLPPSETDLP